MLAGVDDARLERAGRAVIRARGELGPAGWVLECDWPGVEELEITAEQIREGDEEVQRVGAELLLAGLGKSKKRDREVMQMRLGLTGEAMTLKAIAGRFGLSRERIRQIEQNALKHARVRPGSGVRRGWHRVHDLLLAALRGGDQKTLDPDLVLSFVNLAAPVAPHKVVVTLVANLCGIEAGEGRSLVDAVEECHQERTRLYQQSLQEQKKRGRLTAKVQQLADMADWPTGQPRPAGGEATPLLSPLDPDKAYSKPGRWLADRLGREVGYDSEAELRIIQMLDGADDLIASYCEQPVKLSYTMYGHRHDYYPDLLVDLRDGRRLLIEVKARLDEFALYKNVVKFEAAQEFCRVLGWGFLAVTDRLQTPITLVNRQVDASVEQALRHHLSTGPTDWHSLSPLMDENHIRFSDIATLALRHGWHWHRNPFWLSTTPPDDTPGTGATTSFRGRSR